MNKSNYGDELSKLATVNQARNRYKMSRGFLMEIVEQSGAVRRFGRSIRIDIPTMDAAIDAKFKG